METILNIIGLLLALYIAWEILRLFIWDVWEGRISRSTFILIILLSIILFQSDLGNSELIREYWMELKTFLSLYPKSFVIGLLFVFSNIIAKRFRDTGGSGWVAVFWTFLLVLALPQNIGTTIAVLVLLYLLIFPSSKLKSR